MTTSINTPILTPLGESPLATPGRIAKGTPGQARHESALDTSGAVAQVTTINVTAATNSDTYTVRFVFAEFGIDESISYTSDASATQTEVRDGLIAAAEANAALNGAISFAAGTNTVVATSRIGGADYTFVVTFTANPSTDLTQTATTAAADFPIYYMGRAAQIAGVSSADSTQQLTCTTVQALTGPIETSTITHGAGATYTASSILQAPDGTTQAFSWSASAGANLAATLVNAQTAILAALAAIGVNGGSNISSPDVTMELPPGWVIIPVGSDASGGGGAPAISIAVTDGSAVPEYALVRDPRDQETIRGQANNAIIADGTAIPLSFGGADYAAEASGTAVSFGDSVYVETASGANAGLLYPEDSTTRALFAKGAKFLQGDTTADYFTFPRS